MSKRPTNWTWIRSTSQVAKSSSIFAIVSLSTLISLGFLHSQASSPHSSNSPDFDGNGTVGFSDFVLLAEAFGSVTGDARYDARFDLNGNGAVGFGDFVIFASRFGDKVPVFGGDRDVLVALYEATDGPNWTNNTNWLTDKDLSTWHGVGVYNSDRVAALVLSNNNLRGTIPEELGRLANLTELSFFGNHLRGDVPSEIGQLSNLAKLNLSGNQIAGRIPEEIGQLANLATLSLFNNRLTGSIPPEIGELNQLTLLNLAGNNLNGAIPVALGQLAKLEKLYLGDNELTGTIPGELGKLTALVELYLDLNELTGTIPGELGELANLIQLSLAGNELAGTVPSELGELTNLESLLIPNNDDLTGLLPRSFTSLTLKTLNLQGTEVCVPSNVSFHAWLEAIPEKKINAQCLDPERDALVALYNRTEGPNWTNRTNWLRDAILGDWYGVTTDADGRVTGLGLRGNNLRGTIPYEFGGLTGLKTLDFSLNPALSGPLPTGFTGLALDSLALDGTQVCAPPTEEFMSWISRLSNSSEIARCADIRADYYALVELYNGTDGSNWTNTKNWGTRARLDEWHGVTVNAEGRVTRLFLADNNLRGTIPRHLGQLSHLTSLNLNGNKLSGRIPQELAQLTNLTELTLSYNQLSGKIPKVLGKLTNLEELILTNNELTGGIPPELGKLTNIKRLSLPDNQLSGTIPEELWKLNNLTDLNLNNNVLRGEIPPELGKLAYLERLNLSRNQFSGGIHGELGKLYRLIVLNLSNNQLSGVIPKELGGLTNLTVLRLAENRLAGGIPAEIGRLTSLASLQLTENQLTGTIPSELGKLRSLKRLNFRNNQLTGSIPRQLGQLANLEELVLTGNQLTGKIPPELGQLANLKRLNFSGNQLTGSIPPASGQLTNLSSLNLVGNWLTGTIPVELGQLTNLKSLALGRNKLTGTIPVELGLLTNLEQLWLGPNELSGTIPVDLGRLSNLIHLNLDDNRLAGTIPVELGRLTNLVSLTLGRNELMGVIPVELGRLTNLENLLLYENHDLIGPLPGSFTGLNLKALWLRGTGLCVPQTDEFRDWLESIPSKLVNAQCSYRERDALVALYNAADGQNWINRTHWLSDTHLGRWYGVTTNAAGRVTGLNLRANNLKGTVPNQLGGLTHLKTLDLSSNADVFGPMPAGLTRLTVDSLAMDGTQLCAPPRPGVLGWLSGIRGRTEIPRCTDTRMDYYALMELFNATDGTNWKISRNWTRSLPLGAWHGVTTDSDGRVTALELRENNLRGTIPKELGQLNHLTSLSLRENQLTGEIPPEIGRLTNLTYLDLSANQLTGEIPPELVRLVNLTSLNLSVNSLTGEISPALGQLTNLTALRLSNINLSGVIPPALGKLDNLRWLLLGHNELTGPIPPDIGRLTNLERLNLVDNRLTGTIPPELTRLTNLDKLDLGRNQLTGTIPAELGRLVKLYNLHLNNNQLTGRIPPGLGQIANLVKLDLARNQLTGGIPGELGKLTNLRFLYLYENQLSDGIPPELGNLANLTELQLNENRLTERIPPELGQLTKLERLILSTNELSGMIPRELGQLSGLRWMDLSKNRLSGEMPPELGRLRRLNSLNLAFNGALSGSIPPIIRSLSLGSLLLNETLLCVPQETDFLRWLSGIPDSRVPDCSRTDRSVAYLTQSTQSVQYPVSLVAGEAALLRVFVTADPDVRAAMPPVRATFFLHGAEVHTAEIGARETSLPWQVNEGSLLNSANAVVPGAVVMPGLEMVVEIDPGQTLEPAQGVEVRLPRTGRTAVNVRSVPPLDLTLVPFLWNEDPDSTVLTETKNLTSESDLFRLTRDLLPVDEFRLAVHEPVLTSLDPTGDSHATLMSETGVIYAMEGWKGHYMGIFRERGQNGLRGIATLPGRISMSVLDGNVIAHELGHNLNLYHAPGCNAGGPDPDFPTEDGSIGGWGYDFRNETLVTPITWDLMSYCHPQWISEYSFSRAMRHRIQESGAREAAAHSASGGGLLLWGGLNGDNELFLEPAFVVSAAPNLPRMDGPYRLTGEAEDGSTVFEVAFGLSEIACGGTGGSFAFIVPVEPDWPGSLTRIALSGPEGVSMLDGEEGPAAALLLDRSTGNVRGILRDWAEPAAKRAATTLGIPEPELDVLVSRGIPDAAAWTR